MMHVMLNDIKELLDMEDTELFDNKLSNLLIPASIVKLQIEGVKEIETTNEYYSFYCICVAYNVALNMNLDINQSTLQRLYLTSVNSLRNRKHE